MELAEREQILMEVKTSLGEMSRLNKDLKRSNEELQLHLAQTQQQLARQSLQSRQANVQMVLSSQDGSESDDENSDEDGNIRPLLPFPVPGFSLPMETSSIHTELKGMLEEGRSVACPLSGKEQQETLSSDEELLQAVSWDNDMQHFLDHLTHITLESFMSALMATGQPKPSHGENWGNYKAAVPPPATAAAAAGVGGRGEGDVPEDMDTSVKDAEGDKCSDSTCSKLDSRLVNQRLKQFLHKVKKLNEENRRLQHLHQSAVDSFLSLEGREAMSQVASADTRVMVLRDILQEERCHNLRLQEQVVTLKKILGIVDRKDSVNFDTFKNTLCRQQDKIDHLKRSNLELAEKYHKAELKITDLQEEAQEATLQLERERHRCSKLEEAVNSSTQARQLDLWDIWRLVQKDIESDHDTTQEGRGLLTPSDEIKERILEEIQNRDKKLKKQLEAVKGRERSGVPMSLPLQRSVGYGKLRGHCCGFRCTSPSSPLVDALTIDFFNGNYYPPLPKKSRGVWQASQQHQHQHQHEQQQQQQQQQQEEEAAYMNYLRLCCEDVDCMACRAYRLGLDFHGVASCPALQLKLPHDLSTGAALGCRDFHGMVTALDYNFNSQPLLDSHLNYKNCDAGASPTASTGVNDPPTPSDRNDNHCSGVGAKTPPVPCRSPASADHRRLDFRQGTYGTSGTTDSRFSYTSTSQDSNDSPSDFPSRFAGMQNATREQPEPASQQCSPAGFRRMSFLTAVDKSKRAEGDWNRRPSYRAAIDPRYLAGEMGEQDCSEPDGLGGYADGSRAENKSVTFQLGRVGGGQGAGEGGRSGAVAEPSWSSSSLSSSTDSDNAFWGPGATASSSRGTSGQPRKLSILLEEEDAEDTQRTPEKRSSMSSFSGSPNILTPRHFDFSNTERHEAEDAHMDFPDGQRSGAHNSVHGSPLCASPAPLSNATDVKAFLMASEGSPGVGGQAACNADNLPAHFKHRSELPSPTPSPPPPSSPSPSPSSSTTTTTTPAAASTSASPTAATSSSSSSSVSSSSVKTASSLPQSLVLVPGSPPQTPRAAHDNTALPAALPSRLAQLRQSNLAKKREQMKTMKMPELSEHAESSSDSEMSPALTLPESPAANGAPPPTSPPAPNNSSSSSPRSPTSPSSSSFSPRTKFATAPQVSVTCVDDDDGGGDSGGGENVEVVKPPSPTEDPVTPSIPESFLKQLGLLSSKAKDDDKEEQSNGGEPSVERLPDKQLESRFNSLALAFKTDRLTLDKRLSIQERSRDIAEQNIDRELQGLRDAVEVLKQLCEDERVHSVISRIQHHLDILEHSVARLSSRAEVFGAVQQEKRMCLAMEVMVTYTENIQRLRATEQSEVEEARRVLNSSRQIGSSFSLETLSIGDRRSASVCAGLNNPRAGRRRSEVALPRFFGGTGSPSLHISPSMEPRQRFQSATANITVRNVVTNTLRRASLERQKSLGGQNSNTVVTFNHSPSSSDKSRDKEQVEKQNSQEEEAYRHGYEEGLKASLSRELTDLRDQQATISTSLEEVMDRVDTYHTHSPHSDIDDAMSRVRDVVVKARAWMSSTNRHSARQLLRGVGAALFFVMALVVAVVTLTPLVPGHISLRNHDKSAQ